MFLSLLCAVIFFFAIMVSFIRQEDENGVRVFCNHDKIYSEAAIYTNMSLIGALAFCITAHLKRLLESFNSESFKESRKVLFVSMLICAMQMTTNIVDMVDSKACVDGFGVYSDATMWASWVVAVPLKVYAILIPKVGDVPNMTESFAIILNAIMILSGFSMQLFSISFVSSVMLFSLGCFCFMLSLHFIYAANQQYLDQKDVVSVQKRHLKSKLSVLYVIVMPSFPIIYILATMGFIDSTMTVILLNCFNVIAKGYFGLIVMDMDMHTFYHIEALLTSEVQSGIRHRSFLRYMFHELRIPLNAISMSVSLTKYASSKRESELFLNNVGGYVEYMEKSLDRYMLVQQLEEGSFKLESFPFSLINIRNRLDEFIESNFRNSGPAVVLGRLPSTLPPSVAGDFKMIVFALENIIAFAIHRSVGHHTVHIEISDRTTGSDMRKNKCVVLFRLSDNGPALSDREIANIFEPFSCLMLGEMTSDGSSALGLFIAKEIISRYNNQFSVKPGDYGNGLIYEIGLVLDVSHEFPAAEARDHLTIVAAKALSARPKRRLSKPREPTMVTRSSGTSANTFQEVPDSRIPARKAKRTTREENIMEIASSNHASEIVYKDLSRLKVLVVDDAPSNRKLLQRMLQQKGISSHGAEDGKMAVDFVHENKGEIDLIFMDFSMPVMNGVDATAAIRGMGYKCAIVAVTGNAVDDDVNAFFKAGAECVQLKPMTMAKLDAVLSCFVPPSDGYNGATPNERLLSLTSFSAGGASTI